MQLKIYISWLILHVLFLISVINAKNFKGPPIIKKHPQSIVVRRNDPLTLKCAASGAQEILWFRNGQRVISTRQNAHSHRLVLPDGSLFFLRVTNNKRDGDAGVYWCVATNRRGKARSHNATLNIAFLDEFNAEERTVSVVGGAKAILPCGVPRGLPKPGIKWKHRTSVVEYDSRHYTNVDGDLIIIDVTSSDTGHYFCEVSNLAGTRKSPKITLELKDTNPKPSLIPIIANIHDNIILPCNSFGKISSNVTWKKKGGIIPIDRSQIVKKNALEISNLAFSDTGEYFCESVGNSGTIMADVTLIVYQKPEIMYRSPNQLVSIGGSFNVTCNNTGNPEPLVVWKVPSGKDTRKYLLPGQSIGATHATISSSVIVSNAERSNSGSYTCWIINSISAISATSTVSVLKTFPPPLMGTKPQHLGRREGSTATFPCEAASEFLPANITWWYRNDSVRSNVKLQTSAFVSILPIGALVIRNVSITDAGTYTCEVASEAGSVKEEVILTIDNLVVGSHPTRYVPRPAPPSKPVAISISGSSILISWMPNSKRSSGEVVMYSIEMWTSPWPKWESVITGVLEESSYITGLKPNKPYLFVVKALNMYGSESFPSPWSDVITTSVGETVDLDEQKSTHRRLNRIHVALLVAKEISPGTVDLSWKVHGEKESKINTFAVYLIEKSVINRFVVFGTSPTYRLHDLPSNSYLTIFVAPIAGSQEGTPSNSIKVETGHSKDFQLTPHNIESTVFASGYVVTWQDPSPSNVIVSGYKILAMSNGTTTYYSTNETSIKLDLRASFFSVKVAIITEAGQGPWSEPRTFHGVLCCEEGETMPSVLYSPFHPAWFLYLLIPTGLLVIVLSLLYLRYVRKKSPPPCVTRLSSPVYYSDSIIDSRQQMNIYEDKKAMRSDTGLRPVQLLKTVPIVAEYAEPRCRYDDPEPYATTALLAPNSNYVTSHYKRGDCGLAPSARVNWSNMIPPPPQEPPPVEVTNWNIIEGCDRCHHDSDVYEHPCNAVSSIQSHYVIPHSPFTRFTSLQVPKRQESFKLEVKSSTH